MFVLIYDSIFLTLRFKQSKVLIMNVAAQHGVKTPN